MVEKKKEIIKFFSVADTYRNFAWTVSLDDKFVQSKTNEFKHLPLLSRTKTSRIKTDDREHLVKK